MEEPEKTEPAENAGEAQDPKRAWRKRLGSAAGHPLAILVYLVVFSLVVGENYPFTPYPMYAGTASKTHYLFIEDESGNPLATALTFRVSTPKVKKMYNKFAEQLAKKRGLKKAKDLGEQGKRVAGERLLDHLRTLGPRSAKERQVTMQPLTLVRIDVQLEDGEFIKERSVVVRNY